MVQGLPLQGLGSGTTRNRNVAHLFKKMSLVAVLTASSLALAQAAEAERVLADAKGFDFSTLAPQAKRELSSVLTDEFDSCGRPLTLLASLKKGDACKHTRRMVALAASLAATGSTAGEILVELSRHNQAFGRPRAPFKVDDRACVGPRDAKVTLVEFSDFECPFCASARPVLEAFVQQRPQARLCWSPFPLDQHPNAKLCGQAALFARDAGKFWAVHDALFENQLSISADFVRQLLARQGLDVKAFEKAVAAGKYLDELNASKEAGKNAGVDSTPTLFLNGRKHQLGFTPEGLGASLDDELDWITGNNGWPAN
jgi:protein-disulfide isomerase